LRANPSAVTLITTVQRVRMVFPALASPDFWISLSRPYLPLLSPSLACLPRLDTSLSFFFPSHPSSRYTPHIRTRVRHGHVANYPQERTARKVIYSRWGVSMGGRGAVRRRRNEEEARERGWGNLKRTKRYPFSRNANGRTSERASVEGRPVEERRKARERETEERRTNEKVEGSSLFSEEEGLLPSLLPRRRTPGGGMRDVR